MCPSLLLGSSAVWCLRQYIFEVRWMWVYALSLHLRPVQSHLGFLNSQVSVLFHQQHRVRKIVPTPWDFCGEGKHEMYSPGCREQPVKLALLSLPASPTRAAAEALPLLPGGFCLILTNDALDLLAHRCCTSISVPPRFLGKLPWCDRRQYSSCQ